MKIIDSHTHFFAMEGDRDAWATDAREDYWRILNGTRPDGKRSLQGFPTIDKFLHDMDAAGVEHAVIQGWYWVRSQTCKSQNAAIAKIVKTHPDRFSAFASVNIGEPREAAEIVDSARDMGFVGFGELHEKVQGFDWLSSEFDEFAERAAELKMPICVHLTKRESRQYFGKSETDNLKIFESVKKHPNLKFILAHWGGSEIFKNGLWFPQFADCDNAYFDSAASPLLHDKSAWNAACKLFCKKVIFGSDYPLRLYPKRFKVEEMRTIVEEATQNVEPRFAESFFYDNFKQLTI